MTKPDLQPATSHVPHPASQESPVATRNGVPCTPAGTVGPLDPTAPGPVCLRIGFLRIAARSCFSTIYGPHWPLVGLTVGISLVGIVLWGTLCGSMLPFLIKRCGLDPATSSAPFVATLVDVTGLVIYFTVALVVLHGTLL